MYIGKDGTNKILQEEYKNLTGIALIGYVKEVYEVYVNTDDIVDEPHFHIGLKNSCDKFHSCIKILSCEYFEHDGKKDKLNSRLSKALVAFLQDKDENEPDKTHWQVLVTEWNRNNPNRKIDKGVEMPNYLDLK